MKIWAECRKNTALFKDRKNTVMKIESETETSRRNGDRNIHLGKHRQSIIHFYYKQFILC